MYPEIMVIPMREELTRLGIEELRTSQDVDRALKALALADEFATDIDVAIVHAHGAAGDQTAFDQQMRIVPHDLAVLAGAGL